MVTINLTIVVQLVLFLLFLWVMNKLVLQPVLRRLDEREHDIEQNARAAKEDAKTAKALESQYTAELSAARRAAAARFARERAAAMDSRNQRLTQARHDGDRAVMAVEREGKDQIAAQRGEFDAMAAEVADAMARQLQLKGDGR